MIKAKIFALSLVLTLGSLFLFSQTSFALEVPPKPSSGYVLDLAEILSPEEEQNLNQQIQSLRNESTNEIGILTIRDGEGIDPAQFSVQVGRDWGVGTKEFNNGALILITLENPKRIFIATGTGLEGALPDALAGQISRDEIAPKFREKKYGEGLSLGVGAISSATKGEYQANENSRNIGMTSDLIFGLFFAGFILLQFLFGILAKSKSWWLGGVFGFVGSTLTALVVGSTLFAIVLNLIFIPLGLLIDYKISKNYKKHKSKKDKDSNYILPWYFGGGGSGGSSSGGFGGFSGGGGFGGGGGGSSW
jgi:uncharacterized protein